jgi:hypothetical protein
MMQRLSKWLGAVMAAVFLIAGTGAQAHAWSEYRMMGSRLVEVRCEYQVQQHVEFHWGAWPNFREMIHTHDVVVKVCR